MHDLDGCSDAPRRVTDGMAEPQRPAQVIHPSTSSTDQSEPFLPLPSRLYSRLAEVYACNTAGSVPHNSAQSLDAVRGRVLLVCSQRCGNRSDHRSAVEGTSGGDSSAAGSAVTLRLTERLRDAVRGGRVGDILVWPLVGKGADLHGAGGESALSVAALYGNVEAMKILLQLGARHTDTETDAICWALFHASFHGDVRGVKLLAWGGRERCAWA